MFNNRRMAFVLPNSANRVFLVFQDNHIPIFKQGKTTGDTFSLHFGNDDFGDTYHALVAFTYKIKPKEGGYEIVCMSGDKIPDYLKTHELALYFYEQKPKIDELINKLSISISNQQAFDFFEYTTLWEELDEDFYIWVFNYPNQNV